MAADKPIQTAEGRLKMLQQAGKDFSDHLETVPGAALPPWLRLQVTSCARDALDCKACAEMQQACLPPSVSLYSICCGANHSARITGGKNDEAVALCVTSTMHAIVNQQSKLNEAWFKDSIQAIKKSGLIPEGQYNQEGVDLACYSAFAEIVVLASVSVGLEQAFTALGETVPSLPTKAAPGPLNIDFSSMLKRVRRDERIVAMPYYLPSDIDKTSSQWMKLRQGTRETIGAQLNPMSPAIGLCLAPEDLIMFDRFMGAAYMMSGFVVAMTWIPLDTSRYCPSASSVAALASPRAAALTEFGRKVATLPYNKEAVEIALAKVQDEGGEELKVEMCCTVAGFEAVTRVADATLRKEPSGAIVSVIKGINNIMHHSRELILTGSAIAAVGVAVAIATRRS